MQKQSKNMKGELQSKVDKALSNNQVFGLVILAFVTVIREGIETALFLSALQGEDLLLVASIAFLLYKTTIKLDLRKFFIITGSLLILVAAGLMTHTVHALGELGIVPTIVEKLWNLEWLISNEILLGRILHAFIGYESTPTLMQVIVYTGYILIIGRLFLEDSSGSKISKNT